MLRPAPTGRAFLQDDSWLFEASALPEHHAIEDEETDEDEPLESWQPCVVFLDYDDTLFPTEALFAGHDEAPSLDELTCEFREAMQDVDLAVHSLLLHAVYLCGKGGAVQIVTAASVEWVRRTLPSLLPHSARAVRDLGIRIAASTEPDSAPSPGPWHKARAFHEMLLRLPKGVKSVLSVGDGLQERVALHFVAEHKRWESNLLKEEGSQGAKPVFEPATFKSLRLRQMPRIESLLQELRFLREFALEDLLRSGDSAGRDEIGAAADLYLDPWQLQTCIHSDEDRAVLWALVDNMRADWNQQGITHPPSNSQLAERVSSAPAGAGAGPAPGGALSGGSAVGALLRALPRGMFSPLARCQEQDTLCPQCDKEDSEDIEVFGTTIGEPALGYGPEDTDTWALPDPDDEHIACGHTPAVEERTVHHGPRILPEVKSVTGQ